MSASKTSTDSGNEPTSNRLAVADRRTNAESAHPDREPMLVRRLDDALARLKQDLEHRLHLTDLERRVVNEGGDDVRENAHCLDGRRRGDVKELPDERGEE